MLQLLQFRSGFRVYCSNCPNLTSKSEELHSGGLCSAYGKAELIEPFSDKYNEHAEIKKIPIEALKKLESPMNLICVTPVKMDVLFSDFKKDGYSIRQILK